jgi:hypothetical protein
MRERPRSARRPFDFSSIADSAFAVGRTDQTRGKSRARFSGHPDDDHAAANPVEEQWTV